MAYITGRIPNGNCGRGEFTDGAYHLRPIPDDRYTRTGKNNIWFHFLAEIIGEVGEEITVHIHWPQYDRLNNMGYNYDVPDNGFTKKAPPFGTVVPELLYTSTDGVCWRRVEDAAQDYGSTVAKLVLEGERTYLSVGYPYTWQMADRLREDMDGLDWVRRETLGLDGGKEEIVMYTCTDFSVPAAQKQSIWFQGAQHCCETHGSCMADAMLRFLAGPEGAEIRKRYIFHFVPVVSVWNWLQGRGEHMSNVNPNRDWGNFVLPETRIIAEKIRSLIAGGERFALAFDVHTGSGLEPPGLGQCVTAIWAVRSGQTPTAPDGRVQDEFIDCVLENCDFPPTAPGSTDTVGSFAVFCHNMGIRAYTMEIARVCCYDRQSGKNRFYTDEVMDGLGKDFARTIALYLDGRK